MKLIDLSKGYKSVIDDEDFKRVSLYKWSYGANGYAKRCVSKGKFLYLHRFILNSKQSEFTDHINGDRLDNRRSNLRIVNKAQNSWNRKKVFKSNTSSIYKGVVLRKDHPRTKPWMTMIRINNHSKNMGSYQHEENAALNYDLIAFQLFGKYAKTNYGVEEINLLPTL